MTRIARFLSPAAALVLAAALACAPATPADAAKRPRREEASRRPLEHVSASRAAFGVTCEAEVEGRARAATERATADALEAIAALGAALDRGAPASELARVEREAGATRVPCSPGLWGALLAALDVARETNGVYDPTAAAIADTWRAAGGLRPDGAALADARQRTGWGSLALEPGARAVRFTRTGTALDLAGVGRGFALDRAVDSLRARGMRRARLALGEVEVVFADEGDGWAWTLPDPREPGRVLLGLRARQAAIATSGAGTRLHDPRTGMPVLTEASVTVIARSAARAQAIAIALRILGRDAAAAFAERHRDLGVVWLEVDGSTVNGWRWNAPTLIEAPGARVRWVE
jgi:FAD:protein FMN transferase